jgi:F-type H+-transporting ATPase subunit delta
MRNEEVGKNYAEAIYDVAEKQNKLLQAMEDLKFTAELYEHNIEFREVINSPSLDIEVRKKIVNGVLKSTIDPFTVETLNYLIEKGRFFDIASINGEYQKIYNSKNNFVEVEAIFAIEPTEVQKKKMVEKLEKSSGKKVKLKIKIDKSIIGGGIVKIGDKIIDGSIRRQLDMLKSNL